MKNKDFATGIRAGIPMKQVIRAMLDKLPSYQGEEGEKQLSIDLQWLLQAAIEEEAYHETSVGG